jgi:hypothetical protein
MYFVAKVSLEAIGRLRYYARKPRQPADVTSNRTFIWNRLARSLGLGALPMIDHQTQRPRHRQARCPMRTVSTPYYSSIHIRTCRISLRG